MPKALRKIGGILYRCRDVGCPNLARAAWNRVIVKEGLFTTFWVRLEKALEGVPRNKPLPSWIPLGVLPQASEQDWRQHGGGREPFHEEVREDETALKELEKLAEIFDRESRA